MSLLQKYPWWIHFSSEFKKLELRMNTWQKSIVIGIGLIGLSFQANSYETDAYAKVVSSKAVWSVKTISQPISHEECEERLLLHWSGNLVGDIIIGGLIGAAIGNAVSDAHGMGALGTSLGALFVADSYDQSSPTYKCTRKTIYREQQEKVLNHYDVKVRLHDKFITFKSNRPLSAIALSKCVQQSDIHW